MDVFTVVLSVGDDDVRTYQVEAVDAIAAKQIVLQRAEDLVGARLDDRFALVEFDDSYLGGEWLGIVEAV